MSGFQKVQVTNDNGASLIMESTDTGYLLSSVDLGQPPENDNTAKLPFCHGEFYQGFHLGPRDITLAGHCFSGDYEKMQLVFSPFSFVTLTFWRGNVVRTARGKPSGVFTPNKNPPYDFTVVFRCFDPFFYGAQQRYSTQWIRTKTGTYCWESVIHNDGGVSTPLMIRFVTNPSDDKYVLLAETAEKITINGLETNDEVEISTMDGNRYVRMNGQDISDKLTEDSVFFQLPPGRSTIQSNNHLNIWVSVRYLEI